ncbi:MAG: KUP/HAK/KT family potassium transporter [Chitinophagaceae bacterium]|nr:KUP/HAK/KT family potassium transporter [Chitinophagaceae bacterium]
MSTNAMNTASFHQRVTFAGMLIAVGIVFGDIGTSPLYTLNAVFHGKTITEDLALGALSCIFWTLVFQTSIKYVLITLQADNKGEGGIFSLYALIRRYFGKWLIYPAMAGGAFLMADGIITPPISVASAIEGVQKVYPAINTIPIIIGILVILFLFQQFGTQNIGRVFGPVMIVWFGFIGILGIWAMGGNLTVLKALNPSYAYHLLINVPEGFWLLGGIFLCTTGAEALYSDMGHCGRNNIRISWIFIKIMLVFNYAGQTAWLLQHTGTQIGNISPFFHIVPDIIYWPALIIATLATIIASQALISGCFTLINEAIRLDIWPRHLVIFPSNIKGQLYIPFINWTLMAGCIAMVIHFEKSTNMEAAFGLSVTLTMLMSTFLILFYMISRRIPLIIVGLVTAIFLTIEISFLIANLQKVKEGGWITLLIGSILFMIMFIWQKGRKIKSALTKMVALEKYLPLIKQLSIDPNIPKFATNAVYLTTSPNSKKIERKIIDSILTKSPKRADIYWFVHVNVLDEPYAMTYRVETIAKNDTYFIVFELGFRVEPRIDYFFRQVVQELSESGQLDLSGRFEMQYQENIIGDFKFVLSDSFLSFDNDMPLWKNFIMKSYFNLKYLAVKESVNFGLDQSNVIYEKYPLIVNPIKIPKIKRSE